MSLRAARKLSPVPLLLVLRNYPRGATYIPRQALPYFSIDAAGNRVGQLCR